MNSESIKLSKQVKAAERPFAKRAFDKRLKQLYPGISDNERKSLVMALCNQIYKKTLVSEEEFKAIIVNNGLTTDQYLILDNMVGDMVAAFVGLGPDILELGPDSVRWSAAA